MKISARPDEALSYRRALEQCAKNGGLDSADWNTITCNDGARFDNKGTRQ